MVCPKLYPKNTWCFGVPVLDLNVDPKLGRTEASRYLNLRVWAHLPRQYDYWI